MRETIQRASLVVSVPLVLLLLRLEGRSLGDALYILQPFKEPDRYDALLDPVVDISPPYVRETSRNNHASRYAFAVQLFDTSGCWDTSFRHLDIACGTGYASEILTPSDRNGRYVGADISRRALDYATTYYGSQGRYIQSTGTTLPFREGSFDSLTCIETIEHVPDDRQLLEELERVLAENGSLVLTTPYDEDLDHSQYSKEYPHVNTYTYEDLTSLVGSIFSDRATETYVQHTGVREGEPIERPTDRLHPYGFSRVCEGQVPPDSEYLLVHVQ